MSTPILSPGIREMKRAILFFPSLRSQFKDRRFRGMAFSLIELLMVMVIMSVLATLMGQGFGGVSQSLNLTSGGSMVAEELEFARQTALSKNETVEFRIYRVGSDFDTVVSVIPPNAMISKVQWLEKPNTLPGSVVFCTADNASGGLFSTLITQTAGSSPQSATSDGTALYALRGKPYVYFRFRSDGSTDLDGDALAGVTPGAWYLTLRNKKGASGQAGAPARNFITILLDPVLGRTRVYQPH